MRRKVPPLLALAGAALVLASAAWLWQPGSQQPGSPIASKVGGQGSKVGIALEHATADDLLVAATEVIHPLQQNEPFEAVLVAEQVALLNHDARLATDWVLDPLKLAMAD